jgi:hypothetical protein
MPKAASLSSGLPFLRPDSYRVLGVYKTLGRLPGLICGVRLDPQQSWLFVAAVLNRRGSRLAAFLPAESLQSHGLAAPP